MKLAYDISQIVYGTGVSFYTTNLVKHVARRLRSTDTLILFAGTIRNKPIIDNYANSLRADRRIACRISLKVVPLGPKLLARLWNHWHYLNFETLIRTPIDLLHTSDWAEPPSRIPKITTVHDLAPLTHPDEHEPSLVANFSQRLKHVVKESAHIITVSDWTKKELIAQTHISDNRISVTYEALPQEHRINITSADQKRFQAAHHLTKPFILVVGSRQKRKNLPRTIAAFEQFNKLKQYQLLVVGETGTTRTDRPDIIYAGRLTATDMACAYRSACLLLYVSLAEGFGLPLLEAMYHQLPIVTSNRGSLKEIAGRAAQLVDPTDTASICQGMVQAVANSRKLIKLGSERVQRYSWEKTADLTLAVYRQLLNNPV